MKRMLGLSFALVMACGGSVDVGTIAMSDGGTSVDPVSGQKCSSLHGTVTIHDRNRVGWPACAFSFALGTQDQSITRNRYDLIYQDDLLMLGRVSGDPGGWLVDLGDVPLRDVPATVDLAKYPLGQWGAHDALQPYVKHTYLTRLDRPDGTTIAAFRVTGLASGDQITIEWLRSTKTDSMVVANACLP